jgi:NAD(P)-dependent dehydrogenase (short-subunit alcohol dehydrogenase family)
LELKNKVAIITGAAKGIGLGIASLFSQNGAQVIIVDIHQEAMIEAVAAINKAGGTALSVQADVSNGSHVQRMIEETLKAFGTIDILVNNAGLATGAMVENTTEEEWRRVIDVNLTGVFLCSRAVLPIMKKNAYGKIINISSTAGKRISFNGGASYTASKEAVIGFTRHLAYEAAPYGINVNCICPGPTITAFYHQIASPETIKERLQKIPKGRFCRPEDHAQLALFLASDKSDMICGVAIDIDGGSLLGWMGNREYEEKRK